VQHPGEIGVVVEHSGREEIDLPQAEDGGAGGEECADVLQAEELRHLRPLVDCAHVYGGGVQRARHVTEQDAISAI